MEFVDSWRRNLPDTFTRSARHSSPSAAATSGAYSTQQPSDRLGYDSFNPSGTGDNDLNMALREMAIAGDPNAFNCHQQAPLTMPIPPQLCNAQMRDSHVGPSGSPDPNVYNVYGYGPGLYLGVPKALPPNTLDIRQQRPAVHFEYNAASRRPPQFFFAPPQPMMYPPPMPMIPSQLPAPLPEEKLEIQYRLQHNTNPRDSHVGPSGSPDPNVYGYGSGLYLGAPKTFPPNTLEIRQQRPAVHFEYNAATRPPPQFFFSPPQPMMYPPPSPMISSQLPAPSALVISSEKTLEMRYQGVSPLNQAYGNALNYGSQMLDAATNHGSNLSSTPSFGPVQQSPPRHAARARIGLSPMSPMLHEFRASRKVRPWDLRSIAGYVVEFSRDGQGSHFIQNELPNASDEERQSVFDEIVPDNALQLIEDVYGNYYYVIQKLFEHGTQAQKRVLANIMEGHIFHLSCNFYGCRVVQKAIESIDWEHQANFVRELEPHILKCVKDSNCNYVIRKVIERVSPDRLAFIAAVIGHVLELAYHPFGWGVLQRCLEHLPDVKSRPLVHELLAHNVPHLMRDRVGNFLCQSILEHGHPEDKAVIFGQVRGRFLFMARHKFASHVCEKALLNADSESRRALIEEIMVPPTITVMLKDQFATYVLQHALKVAEGDQKTALIDTAWPELLRMRNDRTPYHKGLTDIELLLETLRSPEKTKET